jgi:hypothetical protein
MIRSILALALLPCLLQAQISVGGKYTLLTQGCPGSGGPHVPGDNTHGGSLQPSLSAFGGSTAIRFTLPTTVLAQGVEFWTKSTAAGAKIPVAIHLADAAGNPLNVAAATGTMTVGTTLGWYRGTFTKPIVLTKGVRAFAVFTPPTKAPRMSLPTIQQGFKVTHHNGTNTGGWGKAVTINNWAWKLQCPTVSSLGSAPVVHAPRGGPKVNTKFNLQLSLAPPSAPSLIVTSGSKTQWGAFKLPLDLTLAGAPGCHLFVSLDILILVQADKTGVATLGFGIPNDPKLVNQKFFNQAFCLDGNTNKLGFVFSNGGQAVIGK